VATRVETRGERWEPDTPYLSTKGAVLWEIGAGEYKIEDIVFGEPKQGEVLVKLTASGLCHTDLHFCNGDVEFEKMPMLGGHEGAGVVQELGPSCHALNPGDHVVTTFMPSCGKCHWCSIGRQNLCDRGAGLLAGTLLDGTTRCHTADGTPVSQMTYIGTFSQYIVCPEDSLIKVDSDVPLDKVALIGCGIPTGWGSAVHVGEVAAGDTVVVLGCGGVGMNAVQGAKLAGATTLIAVDPVEWKREAAVSTFGATHQAASIEEAHGLVAELTCGVMADKTIIHLGVVPGDIIQPALDMTSKGGVVVVSGAARMDQIDTKLSLFGLAMYERQVRGGNYGGCNPRADIPRLVELYKQGDLLLDELVTRTYKLEEINQGYADMQAGKNLRGILVFDD
jgi:S-(hydroxymethyl)glutathione dehydrogenase/alcohol dehydrogenase